MTVSSFHSFFVFHVFILVYHLHSCICNNIVSKNTLYINMHNQELQISIFIQKLLKMATKRTQVPLQATKGI